MTPGYCGGRSRIDGARLGVEFIVKQLATGDTPEDIVQTYPDGYVTLAGVYDAMSYYHDHKDQLDAGMDYNSLEAMIARGEIEIAEDGRVTLKKTA